jgi:hypothetical protein
MIHNRNKVIDSTIVTGKKPKKKEEMSSTWEWNDKTYKNFVKYGLTPPDVDFQERQFLRLVKGHIDREVTRIVRLKAINYNAPKRMREEYLIAYENWYGRNYLGQKIPPVTDHAKGTCVEPELEPVYERGEEKGYKLSGQKIIHYIPFSKENVDKLIESSTLSNKDTIQYIFKDSTRRCSGYSYDQFVNSSFEECYTMMSHDGGPERYAYKRKEEERQKKLVEQSNKQYS